MRGAAVRRVALRASCGASVGWVGLAGCTLGVVDIDSDLGPDPSPARMFVGAVVEPHPELRRGVLVTIRAELDPGVGSTGTPRALVTDVLTVDGVPRVASEPNASGYASWISLSSHDAPGPIAVALVFPRIGDLPSTDVNMRLRIPVPPDDTLVVAEGEDLVILADPPPGPFENLEAMVWQLELRSPTQPAFLAADGGRGGWPQEMRIPAAQLAGAAFPLEARFRLRWLRSLVLFELTPIDRLDLTLESDMRTVWTVVRPGPTP
jgi:hypothetical protein